jgi:glucan 1,3-beta-glucosidase
MTGETGWPGDGGSDYGAAIASTSNAASYWKSTVCGLLDWGVDLFWFEAFDEPTKAPAIGQDGQSEDETHWGAFTADRSAKFSLSC